MVWLPLDYRKKTAIDFQKLNFQFTSLSAHTDNIPLRDGIYTPHGHIFGFLIGHFIR